jgi:tetratricopeptide (TPR) repeat protein
MSVNRRLSTPILLRAVVAALVAWLLMATLAFATEPASQPALSLTRSRPISGRCPERGLSGGNSPLRTNIAFSDAPKCGLEEEFFADAADGQLHDFTPLSAALVASGVDSIESLRHYRQKAAALVERFRRSQDPDSTPRQQAEAILDFLHQKALPGGYDLAYTDLRRVLDDGRFNCVSITVLFNYLAARIGLDCRGLEMPGHAMSRVVLVDGPLDIETTCPNWFRLKSDPKPASVGVGKAIGAAGSIDHSKAREVSAVQIAAMIYYNRGVDLLGEKRFREAAVVNAKALRLDPKNATARGNLLATVNNWSIALGDKHQFAEAAALLREGLAMDAQFEAFAQNCVHVHHRWVDELCAEDRFEQAIDVLTRAAADLPKQDYFRRAENEVYQRWAKAMNSTPKSGPALQMPCTAHVPTVD